jgi:hypothetical protein
MSAEKLIGMLSRIVGPRQMATADLMEEWSAADLELDSLNTAIVDAWKSLRDLAVLADESEIDAIAIENWTLHTIRAVLDLSDELKKRAII